MPDQVYSLGANTPIEDEQRVINDTRKKLLVVAAWEPPMGELEDFMQQTQGVLLPLDWNEEKLQAVNALHLDEWRRFCYAQPSWQLQQPEELL